jgi:hypothetical protein
MILLGVKLELATGAAAFTKVRAEAVAMIVQIFAAWLESGVACEEQGTDVSAGVNEPARECRQ